MEGPIIIGIVGLVITVVGWYVRSSLQRKTTASQNRTELARHDMLVFEEAKVKALKLDARCSTLVGKLNPKDTPTKAHAEQTLENLFSLASESVELYRSIEHRIRTESRVALDKQIGRVAKFIETDGKDASVGDVLLDTISCPRKVLDTIDAELKYLRSTWGDVI